MEIDDPISPSKTSGRQGNSSRPATMTFADLKSLSERGVGLYPRGRISTVQSLFESYKDRGYLILAVTLSTYTRSRALAESIQFEMLWTKDFLDRVLRRVPKEFRSGALFDDFTIECCPMGNWHFHGLLAVSPEIAHRIWADGRVNRHLERDLLSFRKKGDYRPCRVNAFEIEPVERVESWVRYIYKTSHDKVDRG